MRTLKRISAYYLADALKNALLDKFEEKLLAFKQGGFLYVSSEIQAGYGANATTIKLALAGS